MPDADPNMTRYLLGELSEQEQAALEEKYFADPRVFEQMLSSESELVDQYARGHLSAEAREKFERTYLAHPNRRERMKFAGALTTRIDQLDRTQNAAKQVPVVSGWRGLLTLSGRTRVLQFSLALASLLLVVGGVWFFVESRRSRHELAQVRADRATQEARVRELEQQIAAERRRTEELTAQLDRQQQRQTTVPPDVTSRMLATVASLVFTVGGVRGSDTTGPQTLVIPAGTVEARLQLNLKENEYSRYRASVQAAGGPEIFSRESRKPRTTKAGASLTFIVPAAKLTNGDYILTLKGISQSGEIEDLSKSIFRVEKK